MLFNLKDDIGERNDLNYRFPDKVEELKQRLAAGEAEVDRVPPPVRVH